MSATDYQIDFNGTVIGNGTSVMLVDYDGFENWSTRNTDVPIPTGWGSIPGSSYVDAKVVAVTVQATNSASILAFEAALIPPQNSAANGLVPIRWKFPNREELLCYGRCARRSRVRSVEADTATLMWQFSFELEFPDPRAYSAVLQQASLTVFVAGGSGFELATGAGVDLGFDLTVDATTNLGFDLVGTSSSGLQTITNLGYVDTYPRMVFAPATGISAFSVTNQTTGQVVTFTQTVNTGQTLIADFQAAQTGSSLGVATIPITVGGTSVYGSWSTPRVPFRLQPGANVLRFDVATGDSNATALVTAPSAYL